MTYYCLANEGREKMLKLVYITSIGYFNRKQVCLCTITKTITEFYGISNSNERNNKWEKDDEDTESCEFEPTKTDTTLSNCQATNKYIAGKDLF